MTAANAVSCLTISLDHPIESLTTPTLFMRRAACQPGAPATLQIPEMLVSLMLRRETPWQANNKHYTSVVHLPSCLLSRITTNSATMQLITILPILLTSVAHLTAAQRFMAYETENGKDNPIWETYSGPRPNLDANKVPRDYVRKSRSNSKRTTTSI
ncbi:hypothetical protein EJ03DRAFT_323633 [Teratosphaeria nubilosa]|uniref:Uncharacterized protein n=1 Tax=Teratosphaeria nubilosa TaxID=161662 RepID=A0A6G1LL62_9PEZI|nr:hypothetical protein EJ03DRAFT_323633 [Teratosphaeria nubilosa]